MIYELRVLFYYNNFTLSRGEVHHIRTMQRRQFNLDCREAQANNVLSERSRRASTCGIVKIKSTLHFVAFKVMLKRMRKNFRCRLIFALFSICLISSASAQTSPDTLSKSAAKTPDTTFIMSKSPAGAAIRSALLPGLGQFYTESYWKIPIILGLSGYLVYGWITNNDLYVKYRDQYAKSITQSDLSGDVNLKLYREFYRDQRDAYAWWFGVLYLVQIADAYVDAHLFDFNVSEEVHASFIFTKPTQVTLSIKW